MQQPDPESNDLVCARIIERACNSGPLHYRVEAIYRRSRGWETRFHGSHTECVRYFQGLLEGLAPMDHEKVIAQWPAADQFG